MLKSFLVHKPARANIVLMHGVVKGGERILVESYIYTQVFGGVDGDDRDR